MQIKKQQLEPDMEQWTGSKLGQEYVKAVYCHPVYSTYMWSTSCKMMDWMKQAEIKIAGENINNLRYADDTTLMAESEEELKSLLMKMKEESEKNWLKSQRSKNEDHGIWSHHFMANRWKQWKQWQILLSWASKSLQMVTVAMKLKDACSLEEKLWPT